MSARRGTFSLHSKDYDGEPTVIQVGYKINGVGEINMSQCIFEVDIKVFLFWVDPKAIGMKEKAILDLDKLGLFNPEIIVSNDHHLEVVSTEPRVTNNKTGEIKCTIHYRGTAFIRDMELNLFPFDCQNLQICLKSRTLSVNRVILVPKPDEVALEHHVVHEWNIIDHKLDSLFAYSVDKMEHSTCFISILAQRQPGWFINNVFIVSAMLLCFAWTTFLSAPEERGGKVDIIVCAIVGSIANKFVVGDELPKVPYRTLVDLYVDLCFLLIMISMASLFVVFFVFDQYFAGVIEHEPAIDDLGDLVHLQPQPQYHTHTYTHARSDGLFGHWGAGRGLNEEEAGHEASGGEGSSPVAAHYAWMWNWILFGASFGIFLLFNLWLLVQIYCVNKDIKLWKNFNPEDGDLHGHRRFILRESHFLFVAGTHHHHNQETCLKPQDSVKMDNEVDYAVEGDMDDMVIVGGTSGNGSGSASAPKIIVQNLQTSVTFDKDNVQGKGKYEKLKSPGDLNANESHGVNLMTPSSDYIDFTSSRSHIAPKHENAVLKFVNEEEEKR